MNDKYHIISSIITTTTPSSTTTTIATTTTTTIPPTTIATTTTTTTNVHNRNNKILKNIDEISLINQSDDCQTNEEIDIEKDISINEFLDFMNISCHLNDMIKNNNNSNNSHVNYSQNISKISNRRGGNINLITTLHQKDVFAAGCSVSNICHNIGSISSQGRARYEIDFKKLSRNRLINDLYGHNKIKCQKKKLLNQAEQQHQQLDLVQQQLLHRQQTYNGIDDSDKYKPDTILGSTSSSSGSNTNIMEKQTRQRRRNSMNCEELASRTSISSLVAKKTSSLALHPKLHEKLEFVINEGILDAVLPYICPIPVPNTTLNARSFKVKTNNKDKDINKLGNQLAVTSQASTAIAVEFTSQINEQLSSNQAETHTVHATKSGLRRKSITNNKNHTLMDMKETEVVIHVVDEVKNSSKDFTCPQSMLIEKMCYFADVTAGQKLDDMDISVHCDIQIFDWLMRWVKHSANIEHPSSSNCCTLGSIPGFDSGPQLDACNVVPILVSANFLQMEPLLLDCLSYCHSHLNDVVRMSTSLSCLNDAIITRLAAMFTNLELEAVRDKKERVTPRLWTKLITSLCEPETEALRGHYYSIAGLFRCSKCGKCLTNTIKSYINCVPNNIRLNRWGQLVSHHVRDPNWEINLYITQLFRELKSWRRVYWKLWGHCHFLYCCVCETHFPVYQMTWCRYHPDNAIYLGAQVEGRLSGPTGRYPCCSQQAFRYDPMPGPNGCQFREHSVLVNTDRERAILAIAQVAAEDGVLCESPPARLREAVAANDIDPRWLGLCLTPTRGRPGLLPFLNPEENMSRIARRLRGGATTFFAESSTESDATDSPKEIRKNASKSMYAAGGHSSSSDGCESECIASTSNKFSLKKLKKKIGRPGDIPGRHWSGELSARSNQDHQREFEEKVMKQVVVLVNKKNGFEQNMTTQMTTPLGGSFVRLEAEWKEQLKQRHTTNNSNNNINNNINMTSNNTTNLSNNNISNSNSSNSGTKPKRLPTIPSTNY